jgi:ABC-type transport system involved in multi-copper enzyme maturation permease subunit
LRRATKILLVGVILVLAGSIGGISALFLSIKDPHDEAIETLYFEEDYDSYYEYDYFIPSQTVYLEKGDYDIWYDYGDSDYGSPGDVKISDPEGNLVFDDDSSGFSETSSDSRKVGSFTIKESGNYVVTVEEASKLYITPPMDAWIGVSVCMVGVVVASIGAIIIIIGLYYYFSGKKEQPPMQPYGYGYPYSPHQYPPPPPPPPPKY